MWTLGSLFDGIGGFPLAAVHNGIKPVWASEVEAFPIRVTKIHFPEIEHLGDITRVDGKNIPPVDIICGGSPCQDLSVAGKRKGLSGERSGLFMEQVRIVKEMRDADGTRGISDDLRRPRYMVWENVPGAFSSAAWLGECWTLNTGESPSVAVESFLWQILEDSPPQRYYLSQKACRGILERVKARGKKLPEQLLWALKKQAGIEG